MENKHPQHPHVDSERIKDVPGALIQPHQIEQAFSSLANKLSRKIGEDPIDRETSEELTNMLLQRLPNEITENIDDMGSLKHHIAERILRMFSANTDRITEEAISTFIMEIMVELGAHHTKGIILNAAPLHDFDGQAPEPFAKNLVHSGKPVAISFQRIGAYGCLVLSGFTSVKGGKNLAGNARDWAMENNNLLAQSDFLQDPQVQVALEWTGGIAAAIGVTAVALRIFKKALAEESHSQNVGFFKAGGRAIGNRFNGSLTSKALALTFIAALGYDVVSNADGIVTMTAGSIDKANQITMIGEDVDTQQQAIREQLNGLPEKLQDQAMLFGQDIVNAENTASEGSSGTGGKGSIYYGKVGLLTDQDEGSKWLTERTDRNTVASDIWGTLDGYQGLGVDTHQNIGEHITAVANPSFEGVATHMNSIDSLQTSLEATGETAVNKARVKAIQNEFEKILELVGEDGQLSGDLTEVMNQYNNVLQAFGDVASSHPGIYKNYNAESLAQLELPTVNIDLGNIEITDVEYKTTYSLVKELIAKNRYGSALFYLFIALVGATLFSYGNDIILGKRVRRAHVDDRKEISKTDEQYIKPLIKGFTRTFDVLLNGAYLNLGKTEPVHPNTIEAAIREYWEEQIEENRPSNAAAEYRAINHEIASNTEEANEHNLRLQTLNKIFTEKDHLVAIITKILPNIDRLKAEKAVGDLNASIVTPNDAKLSRENSKIEKSEMSGLTRRIPETKHTDHENTIIAKIESITNLLNDLKKIRESGDPQNAKARQELISKAVNAGRELFQQFAKVFVEKTDEVKVVETHKSIRETRKLHTKYEKEWDTNLNSRLKALQEALAALKPSTPYGIINTEDAIAANNSLEELNERIEKTNKSLIERDRTESVRGHQESEAKEQREKDKKLIKNIERFERSVNGSLASEPLARANALLSFLGREEVLRGRTNMPQDQMQGMYEYLLNMDGKLKRMTETAEIENKTETVESIKEKQETLRREWKNLLSFIHVERIS